MASSSSSYHSASASSPRSLKYDIFLSFRGEDTRRTFADHLYSALIDRQIFTYKDDETLPRGESIGPSLFEAIEESRIAVIILSENYGESSWCLEELAYIMKCKDERGLVVMPVFYGVDPSEVRKQKGKFGKAFAKQEKENANKVDSWRKALVDASKISGWEPKNIANGNESQVIKKIVDTIFERLFSLNSDIDEDLVGMEDRLQDLKSRLDVGSSGVRMVGIWGLGGSGKTTLATYVYMNMSDHFQGHCIVGNVREESTKYGLKKLQENILLAVCKTEVKVQTVEEGKLKIKSMLCRRNVLVLLDDVNTLDQLEALAGSHKWFGSGSRIIITTRDEHLLRTHKVDNVCPIKLLSKGEAILLFKRHAYNEEKPIEDYETLSSRVVSYADGLPLALKVLGSFLYDKDKNEWDSALEKLKYIPNPKVMNILKISYDGLEPYQKELYLDIACFFRHKSTNDAMEILEACGYHPKIGIKVLIQKALITIVDGMFGMHDLVQEMGHHIVRGEYPNNPEKHSRLWNNEDIIEIGFQAGTMEYDKIEAINYEYSRSMNIFSHDDDSSHLFKIVSKMKKLRLLIVYLGNGRSENIEGVSYLSNELRYINWSFYPESPFPHSFQPMKLVVLKMWHSMQQELWKGYKHLPHLEVLELIQMKKLLRTPDLDGLPRLKKLTLHDCMELEEIQQSHGNHTSLEYFDVLWCDKLKRIPTFSQMKNIKALFITWCHLEDGDLPCGIGELFNLQELYLSGNHFSQLDFSLSQLTRLKVLDLSNCDKLLVLPDLPSSLAILTAQECKSLTIVKDFTKNCKELCQVSLVDGWSDILLQSMLKGKAIENGCMYLQLEGIDIPKRFSPPLLRGSSCRLELPENWCCDFSGFLMCTVTSCKLFSTPYRIGISMKQVSGKDFEDDVAWKESDGDAYKTWVWYISFGSLRHTAWWDQTFNASALSFDIEVHKLYRCCGFGVRLIEKNSRIGLTETTADSSHYSPKIEIQHDLTSALTVSLTPYNSDSNQWHIQ